MKSILAIFSITIFMITSSCSQTQTPENWLKENTSELKTENGYDFSPLKQILKNKRIVALGESTHGLGSFYDLKAKLAIYLHQELDFEVLAMEGGLGDIYMVYKAIDTLNIPQIKGNSIFGNFQANEIDPLFVHMKQEAASKNPLYFSGFDTQASTSYFYYTLQKYIKDYEPALADSIYVRMNNYQKSYGAAQNNNEEKYVYHRDLFVNTAKRLKEIISTHQIAIQEKHALTELDLQVIYRTLDMFVASVNLSYEDRHLGYGKRDELMFENLDWLLTEIYPDKKFMIWAHNAHIENSSTGASDIKWMGHFLKEKYKDSYCAIGLFAYKGEAYQFWTKELIPFENTGANNIEKRLFDTGKKVSFLPLANLKNNSETAWLFNTVNGYELENGGNISFTPTKRFDAVITINQGLPPTYTKE